MEKEYSKKHQENVFQSLADRLSAGKNDEKGAKEWKIKKWHQKPR